MNNTENTFWEMVQSFVSSFWGVKVDRLKKETRLEGDLGITGDDAIEFFDAFHEEFKVDLKDLDLRKYFGGEGFGLINLSWLLGQKQVKRLPYEITLGDLEKVLEIGKWVDPK